MPLIDDDETLAAFVEESKEHLDGIEADLLAIEAAGANIDPDRVNKVFRAVHSLKGGAGFLGLDKVKELAHASENLMNLIRNEELVPTPAIVSTLLDAADLLGSMINHAAASNEVDISAHIAALQKAVSANLEEERKPTLERRISLGTPDNGDIFQISEFELNATLKGGNNLFLLEYDLLADIEQQGKTPLAVIRELQQIGQLIDSKVDIASVGDLTADMAAMRIPFFVLFATIMEIDLLAGFLGIDASRIHIINTAALLPARQTEQQQAAAARPPEKQPAAAAIHAPQPAAQPAATRQPAAATAPPAAAEPPGQNLTLPPAAAPAKAAPAPIETPQIKADTNLRVSVKILDNLMTLAGELVLTRNQLVQAVASRNQQGVDTVSQRLDLVTSELQEAIMTTRMQPVGNIFNKFKRVVRDLSKDLGKEVNLIIEGEEVELDKTIIEAIGDPLTHLVRNSVDHGIETPAVRLQNKKPEVGLLRLSAFHEGGQVIIEIEDDGAGINTDKLKAKVLEMGLHDRAQLESMSAKELNKLIFTPGLSTAKEVTDVSGRGVGMDVVHTNLSKLGGVIDIESSLGVGTTISIKLPLTLAIIPSLIVTCQQERFAIPQVNLVELVRVPAAQVKERIEKIGDALVMRLRGELLPLIHLRDTLGIKDPLFIDPATSKAHKERRLNISDPRSSEKARPQPAAAGEEAAPQPQGAFIEKRSGEERRTSPLSAYNILVLSSGDFHYGLIVDQLLDSEEIVVKPLGSHLRHCKCYAGATIQGDGRVALILDVVGISTQMKLNMVADRVKAQVAQSKDDKGGMEDSQSLLIVMNAPGEQMAVPLGLISRIERIKNSDISITAGRRNIQYRGGSLALFGVEEVAGVGMRDQTGDTCYVTVFPVAGREVGIMFSEIVDILDAKIKIDDVTHKQPGILGSMIIFDKITLLVDLYGVVVGVMPEWGLLKSPAEESGGGEFNVLIVEDSKFFMNQIQNFVSEAGYQTFTAEDGVQALKVLEEERIHLVLTDIEMPNMDGLELTRNIRHDNRWSSLPVIAVTSVAGEAAEERGRDAGVDEYMIKLDREQIIAKMDHYLRRR